MTHPLVDLLIGLIPPKNNDPVKLYNWQWKSLILGVVCLGLGMYAASFIPGIHPAYAMAVDMEKTATDYNKKLTEMNGKWSGLSDQVNTLLAQNADTQKQTLTTNLIEATRYKCRAASTKDDISKGFWTRRWQDLRAQYRSLTGTPWEEVPCSSF